MREMIVEDQIFISAPASFNDPLDCSPAFSPVFSSEGAHALALRYLSVTNPRWSQDRLDGAARKFVRETSKADMALLAQNLRDAYAPLREMLGLYCVSATCEIKLMWSHYANRHAGICVGFASDVDLFREAQRVEYSHVRRTVDPLHDHDDVKMVNTFLQKSADWAYEKEWRYIDVEGRLGRRKIADNAIVEIVLGAKIEPEEEKLVVGWAERRAHRPRLFRALLSPNSFDLNVVPYTPGS